MGVAEEWDEDEDEEDLKLHEPSLWKEVSDSRVKKRDWRGLERVVGWRRQG